MNFLPSCDDREEAIKSLSFLYSVSTEKIAMILSDPKMQKFTYFEINSDPFHYIVNRTLDSSPRYDITHACYYHSTSYSGCESWFNEGLLGASEGVLHFLDKIAHLIIPQEQVPHIKQRAQAVVKCRSELEGSKIEKLGPYAWNTFSAASAQVGGPSYSVPEAIQDLWSPSLCAEGGLIDLSGIIKEHLKPVVVKFKGKTSNINTYCATLWAYLLSGEDKYHLAHTFQDNGLAIPKQDIIELMHVS